MFVLCVYTPKLLAGSGDDLVSSFLETDIFIFTLYVQLALSPAVEGCSTYSTFLQALDITCAIKLTQSERYRTILKVVLIGFSLIDKDIEHLFKCFTAF